MIPLLLDFPPNFLSHKSVSPHQCSSLFLQMSFPWNQPGDFHTHVQFIKSLYNFSKSFPYYQAVNQMSFSHRCITTLPQMHLWPQPLPLNLLESAARIGLDLEQHNIEAKVSGLGNFRQCGVLVVVRECWSFICLL